MLSIVDIVAQQKEKRTKLPAHGLYALFFPIIEISIMTVYSLALKIHLKLAAEDIFMFFPVH